MGIGPSSRARFALTVVLGTLFAAHLLAQNQRFLYVSNWDPSSHSISGFSVNPSSGLLAPLSGFPLSTGAYPYKSAVSPNNKFLYVATFSAGVFVYSINSSTGALTPIAGSPFGPGSQSLILHPSGKFLYVAQSTDCCVGYVYAFAVDATTGALTAVPGSPFPAQGDGGPGSFTIDPAGKFLFTPNVRSNSLTVYSIDQTTGALSFVPGSPFPTPNPAGDCSGLNLCVGLGSGATDPTGRFFYLTDLYHNFVVAWTISPNGSLTPIPGSPFVTGSFTHLTQGYPTTIAVNRNGRFAYVTNDASNSIAIFAVDSTSGALTAIPGSPFSAGTATGPTAFTFSPDGLFAYVANQQASSVSVYSVNSTTGVLTVVTGATYPTGAQPLAIALTNGSSGLLQTDIWVTYADTGNVGRYDENTGQLLDSFFTGHPNATGVTVGSNGDVFAAWETSPQQNPGGVVRYDPSTKTVNPFTTDGNQARGLAFLPDGNLLTARTGLSQIGSYNSTGSLIGTFADVTVPENLLFSAGRLYVGSSPAGVGDIQVLDANSATALFSFGPGPYPRGISIGPDGNIYVSYDGNGSILKYDSSGNLLGTFVSGLPNPNDSAFGPDGNLYVVDSTLGVLVFNGSTGALIKTLVSTSNNSLGSDPYKLAFAQAGPQNCVSSISSAGEAFSLQGGLSSFTVNAAPACSWSATASANWITILPSASEGAGRVNFAVAANAGGARTGTLSVGGQTFNIDQAGFSCSYAIGPSVAALNDAGGGASTVVTAPAGCAWTATSHVGWVNVVSGSSGSGNGRVVINVAANAGASRSGTLTIAGQTFSVTQGAGACGAVDVTSQVQDNPGPRIFVPPIGFGVSYYTQNFAVTNSSSNAIPGPIYFITVGLPTHHGDAFLPESGLSTLPEGAFLSTCFSPGGDYAIPISAGLPPGQTVRFTLNLVQGAYPLSWSTKILSGAPSK